MPDKKTAADLFQDFADSAAKDPAAEDSLRSFLYGGQNIGIFGGAFDPPHMGHVWLAGWALSNIKLDKLLIVPTWSHSLGKKMSSFGDRCQMCAEAFDIYGDKVRVSRIEEEHHIKYTYDLLNVLKKQNPYDQLHLFLGADEWESLIDKKEWYKGDLIPSLATVHVMGREGSTVEDALPPPLPNISSSVLREHHKKLGTFPYGQVPRNVERYVAVAGLYR